MRLLMEFFIFLPQVEVGSFFFTFFFFLLPTAATPESSTDPPATSSISRGDTFTTFLRLNRGLVLRVGGVEGCSEVALNSKSNRL